MFFRSLLLVHLLTVRASEGDRTITPHFEVIGRKVSVEEESRIENLASTLWGLGHQCTKTPAYAVSKVPIYLNDSKYKSSSTYSSSDGSRKLMSISISIPMLDKNLAHEIAHSWSASGSDTLNEGLADLLAKCMSHVGGISSIEPFDSGIDDMEQLSSWENQPNSLLKGRIDTYNAAYRFVRACARVVGFQALYPQSGFADLDSFVAVLNRGNAEVYASILTGSSFEQWSALSDEDMDGFTSLEERLRGSFEGVIDQDDYDWIDKGR